MKSGVQVAQLTQDNMVVKLVLTGAAIYKVEVKNDQGEFVNLALSLSNLADYGKDSSYAGATLGPVAGRIKKGRVPLSDREIHVNPNEGENQIHGGDHNLARQEFEIVKSGVLEDGSQYVTLNAMLPDGLDGWPGNRCVSVTYTLSKEKELTLDFEATTDKETYLDMSNHTYWNLNGYSDALDSGLEQFLKITSQKVLFTDDEAIPNEIKAVEGTPLDFRVSKNIKKVLEKNNSDYQIAHSRGLNHGFILDNNAVSGKLPAAMLWNSDHSIGMALYTNQPSLVVYSGGYLEVPNSAIALEAQNWPDAPNVAGAPFYPLKPGEIFRRYITFKFL